MVVSSQNSRSLLAVASQDWYLTSPTWKKQSKKHNVVSEIERTSRTGRALTIRVSISGTLHDPKCPKPWKLWSKSILRPQELWYQQ